MNPENTTQISKEEIEKIYNKEKHSFGGFFIKRFRITYLILIVIFLFGLFSLLTLPREAEPEIKIPVGVISVIYPGANPSDVEELITNEIEEKLEDLENVKKINSSSSTGVSSIVVEFEAEADLKDSLQKLRDQVEIAKPFLPKESEEPVVSEINFTDIPIVTYSLFGDYTDQQLKEYAKIVSDELETVKDVSRVDIIGGIEREFQIIVDQQKLVQYDLSLSDIVNAISFANQTLPSGEIVIDDYSYNVRVKGKFITFEDLYSVIVKSYNQTPIFLKDISIIQDGIKEKKVASKIGLKEHDPKNAISLQMYKKTGGNILKMVENGQKKIDGIIKLSKVPENLQILKTNDNAVFIKQDLERLGRSGLQTMFLIIFFLFIVLGFRGALITGLSVPIAFFITFFVLQVQGMTLNSIVLFSLVLALGLMVDNSIIIMEGINEYMYHHKMSPVKAAVLSFWNYKWPIVSGTLTTVSAFFPMLLVSGIMGEYMGIIPKTVTAALLSSLFVALIVIPTLASRHYKKNGNGEVSENKKSRYNKIRDKIEQTKKRYSIFLKNLLDSKKKRRASIFISFLLFFIMVSMPIIGLIKIEMFPKVDIDYFYINIELPIGSSLDSAAVVAAEAEKLIQDLPEVDNYVTNLGFTFNIMSGGSGGNGTNLANIIVNLVPNKERERMSYEIAESIRKQVESIQGAKVRLEELSGGPPTGAPIEVRVSGPDLKTLGELSQDVVNTLETIDGVINVKDNLNDSTGEIVFHVNKQMADYYGLSSSSIAANIRNALYGTKATTVALENDDIDVIVKYDGKSFNTIEDLENILIKTPAKGYVSLSEVSTKGIEPSVQSINHIDLEKVVRVTADIEKGVNLSQVLKNFDEKSKNIALDKDYSIEVGGEVEDIQKSYQEMFTSMIVAVFLILFILVLQFNSFKQPLIIMFALPLAMIGALFGLLILRLPFSLPAFIGIVSLTGIVVNDAIVLIDRINKNLKRKMEFNDAIVEAGVSRMQPIFLTSITTIAGILPLALSEEMWQGLGFSIIFGLIFATVLTLVMIPVLYRAVSYKSYLKTR